ncbi:MAG TPA: 2OG-Fe(II) oxygenase [Rhizomicrobium sp.]|nr:2OG-Fe(II) oxygenase [Rhizomicrobium sp.]
MLDFARLEAAQVTTEPFAFTIVPGFVAPDFRDAIETDYPCIDRSGSFPLASLSCGPVFAQLIGELTGPAMRAIVAKKFEIDLESRPVMVTVRGQCTSRDGHIHTDSATKLITMLLYTNRNWECANARLRLLRSPDDLEDYAAEVPPEESTLVIFRNGPRAWHGFAPFHGQRRVIQVNWVTDANVVAREQVRHRVSAFFKRLISDRGKAHAAAH